MVLTPSATRYLLAIYQLSSNRSSVRSVEIANMLSVSRASVVKMLSVLAKDGLIHKEYYGNVQLTPKGVALAFGIYEKYSVLMEFFVDRLNISPAAAQKDAVICLCSLSDEGTQKLIAIALGNKAI